VLRLVGFFLLALGLAAVLGHVPLIGPFFQHTGIIGILVASALLSALFSWWGNRLYRRRKSQNELRSLAAVDSAHNHGKMGVLLLASGRTRAALEHLELAAAGEPAVAEWHFRLAQARFARGASLPALEALERCLALDEEHGYGSAQKLHAALLQRLGRPEQALAALDTLEQNHGPSAESAHRRGQALRALGRREEARRAFAEAVELAARATRYQRSDAALWALRARLARYL